MCVCGRSTPNSNEGLYKERLLLLIETGSITYESYLEWQTSNRGLFTFMLTKAKNNDWIVQTQINQSNLQINKKAEE